MSRRTSEPAPRLVTRAEPSAAQLEASRSRYAYDTEAPHPVVQADSMGSLVLARLITAPVVLTAIGWALDRAWGTGFLTAVGLLVGMALSLATIWLRYGNHLTPPADGGRSPRSGAETPDEEIQ